MIYHDDVYDGLMYIIGRKTPNELRQFLGLKPSKFDSSNFRFEYNPNDVMLKWSKESNNLRNLTENKLTPKHVLVNGDYTTVVWEDGTSTVVKKAPDDQYDFNTAILYAVLKKAAGNNSSALNRYLKIFKDKSVIKKSKEGSK